MSDVVVQRETYILVSDSNNLMYPANDLYPADDLYPAEMEKVENIVAGTMNISEILCQGDLAFGQLYATKFEVQVYDTEDISGKYINVIQKDGNSNYYFVFSGIVDSCKLDRTGTDRTIVAYDLAYSKSYVNVADWWNTFWNTHTTATVKQFRESLLDSVGITYNDGALLNDSIKLTKAANITSMPFSTMLQMVCELSCCFPHFTRTGVLDFVVLDSTVYTPLTDSDYEGENSNFEDFTVDVITGVQYYTSSGEIRYTKGTSVNPYSVSDNLLILGIDDTELATLSTAMLNYISGITYTPASIKMVVGDFTIELGDYIETDIGEFYVFENNYSGPQLIEQTISASGSQKKEEVGAEFDTNIAVMNENVTGVSEGVTDLYEIAEDTVTYTDDLPDDLEDIVQDQIETSMEPLERIVASSTGQEVWDTTGYVFNDNNSGYGAPVAEYESEKVWSNQGYTIEDTTDGKPKSADYDEYDVGKYFMDGTNGNIYEYKKYSSQPGVRLPHPIYEMHLVAKGVVQGYTYDWYIYPELSVGSYYLDSEEGKIYQLTYSNDIYSWTYIKTCDKVNAQLETRISQTESDIILEANQRISDVSGLSSRITVNANNISSEVTNRTNADSALSSRIDQTPTSVSLSVGGSQYISDTSGARINISLYDKNGNLVDSDSSGYIYITGNVIFSSDLTDGVTRISGDNIKTGKISANYIGTGALTSYESDYISIQNTSGSISVPLFAGYYDPNIGSGFYGLCTGNLGCDKFGASSAIIDGRMTSMYCTLTSLVSGSGTDLIITSDGVVRQKSGSTKRVKNSITKKLDEEMNPHKLYDVPVVQFKYNTDYLSDKKDQNYDTPLIGFLAEDLDKIYPKACRYDGEGKPSGWDVYYMVPPMLKLIQEQNQRIKALEDKIKQLQGGK